MDDYILTCLLDIRKAIVDLEVIFKDYPMRFDVFEKDDLHRTAVERKTEIMGEAMARIRRFDPNFHIPNSKDVIATRNRLIHSYDSVQPDFLWTLVIKHIPQLNVDIEKLIVSRINSPGFDSEAREFIQNKVLKSD